MQAVKGFLGFGLLAIAFYIGFARFPLWSVPLCAVLFTAAYIQGKWYLWRDLLAQRHRNLYASLAVTYLIQVVVVFVVYLLGSGVARLFNR